MYLQQSQIGRKGPLHVRDEGRTRQTQRRDLSLLSAIIASWAIRLAQAEVKVCIFIGTSRGATLELKRCLMEYSFIFACAMIPTGASWAPSRTCGAERTQIVTVDGH